MHASNLLIFALDHLFLYFPWNPSFVTSRDRNTIFLFLSVLPSHRSHSIGKGEFICLTKHWKIRHKVSTLVSAIHLQVRCLFPLLSGRKWGTLSIILWPFNVCTQHRVCTTCCHHSYEEQGLWDLTACVWIPAEPVPRQAPEKLSNLSDLVFYPIKWNNDNIYLTERGIVRNKWDGVPMRRNWKTGKQGHVYPELHLLLGVKCQLWWLERTMGITR